MMLAVFKHVNNFFSLISECIYHKQIWNTSLKQAGRDFAGGQAIKTSCKKKKKKTSCFYCSGAGVGRGGVLVQSLVRDLRSCMLSS